MPVTQRSSASQSVKNKKTAPLLNGSKAAGSAERFIADSADGNVEVRGWKKIKQDMAQNILLFKITHDETLKMEWENLPGGVQNAFNDVLATLKDKTTSVESETEGECFVFSFSDDQIQISAICAELNGKVAFFFKED